jgi:hypothetical protein
MAHREDEEGKGFEAPGTLVLVFIFLIWFVLSFVVGWWSLSQVWPVS